MTDKFPIAARNNRAKACYKIGVVLSDIGSNYRREVDELLPVQGIEELFGRQFVSRELERYQRKGPIKTTRLLIDAVKQQGVAFLSLLDIGGGLGVVQFEPLPVTLETNASSPD